MVAARVAARGRSWSWTRRHGSTSASKHGMLLSRSMLPCRHSKRRVCVRVAAADMVDQVDCAGGDKLSRAQPDLLRVDEAVVSHLRSRRREDARLVGADVLFVDAYCSGVAGDMLSAALLHTAEVPFDVIERGLQSLMKSFHGTSNKYNCVKGEGEEIMGDSLKVTQPFDAWYVKVTLTEKSGIVAPRFNVIEAELSKKASNVNGTDKSVDVQSLQSYLKRHRNRNYRDIKAMLQFTFEDGGLTEGAYRIALRAFKFLAEAEAKVHGMEVDLVHFHEVGCVDSIIDIVTVSMAIDYLQPAEVIVSPLPIGRGVIRGAAHGPLPNPAPATIEILCASNTPTYDAGIDVELVTPTGACLVAAITAGSSRWPQMRPMCVAYGCGTKSFADRPNVLRVILGSQRDHDPDDNLARIMSGKDGQIDHHNHHHEHHHDHIDPQHHHHHHHHHQSNNHD